MYTPEVAARIERQAQRRKEAAEREANRYPRPRMSARASYDADLADKAYFERQARLAKTEGTT